MNEKFDPTKPYSRRDGKPARIVHTFKTGNHFVVLDDTDGWVIVNERGEYHDPEYKDYDLINIPRKIEGHVVIYKDLSVSKIILDAEDINFYRDPVIGNFYRDPVIGITPIAYIKVSFTEGDGLLVQRPAPEPGP